jgi:DNA polymerase-3 subunit delta'
LQNISALITDVPFREIIGHRRLIALLSRAVAQERLPPALLFAGPAGVGKRRTAVALAETLNCREPVAAAAAFAHPSFGGAGSRDACGKCASCRRISRGVHPDVLIVEPGDLGSIKIEQIRDVVDRAGYRPFEGRRRVVVIDDADAMVDAAQNALLKTLEEPPSASVFVLVSAIPDALLPTVLSRCPRLRFGALSAAEVAEGLMRDHDYEEAEARAAAVDADGSIGRALSAASADVAEARDIARHLLERTARVSDPSRRLDLAREVTPAGSGRTSGAERDQLAACLRALGSLLRDIGLLGAQGDAAALANADLAPQLRALASAYDSDRTVRAYASVDQALAAIERNASPKVVADWLVLHL